MVFLKTSFRVVLVHSKIERKVQGFPKYSLPSDMHSLPHQRATFITTEEPTLTRHNHPKSTAYIRVHSWWCIFCGFRHSRNDMYLPLHYHTEQFHCPKNSLLYLFCYTLQFLPTTDLFTVPEFCFFLNVIYLESYGMKSSQIGFFHLVTCISVSSMSFLGLCLICFQH